ncbi:MAG: M50 family metallopeptidase [Phenylobacterium sp.]
MTGFLVNTLYFVVPFLLVIGLVITVHELGHFLAGKAVDAKIDQFSIGFGKPIARWKDKSGVEWRLGWLPIGGFVRFAGDDNAASVPVKEDLDILREEILEREGAAALRRYHYFKPLWARALISVAGPLANFLLSIAIFGGLLLAMGEAIAPAKIAKVMPNTPAAQAGLLPGDVLLKANGQTVKTFDTIKQLVILRTGVPIDLLVDRAGRQLQLSVTPVRGNVPDTTGRIHRMGTIGVAFAQTPVRIQHYGPVEALAGGVDRTVGVVKTTLFYLGRMFAGHEAADQISGPLGMAQISHDLAKETAEGSANIATAIANQALTILILAANISVGIGFLNLMPIPVLDGGHLLFYAYEAVARRPLAAKVQAAGYRVGLALVLGLMLFATWNDLQRLRVFNFLGGLHS